MNKSELQSLIQTEVIKCVRSELPKMIKPLVQEAVAGALARIIAEGVIAGPPKPAPAQKSTTSTNGDVRKRITENYSEPIASLKTGNSSVDNILSEMVMGGVRVPDDNDAGFPSILDKISPDDISNISKDYSSMMDKMRLRRG